MQLLRPALARLPDWAGKELERAVDPAKLHQALLDSGAPRSLADEAAANNPYRNMTPDQIVDKYWDAEKNSWKYPSNNGFEGPRLSQTDSRPTPSWIGSAKHPWPPELEVRSGPIAPAFDKTGGGQQWIVFDRSTGKPVSIDDLAYKYKVLEEVGKK